MRISLSVIFLVIAFLVSATGCSLLPFGRQSSDHDPIARAASQERNRYLASIGVPIEQPDSEQEQELSQKIKQAIRNNELTPGMKMPDVLAVWGQPRQIQSAGNPDELNQKWIYPQTLTLGDGRSGERAVYFESGHVVGWER